MGYDDESSIDTDIWLNPSALDARIRRAARAKTAAEIKLTGALDSDSLKARINTLEKTLDRYVNRMALLEALPQEPDSSDDDGPVVYFRKKFGRKAYPNGWQGYQYAAVKAGGSWHVTGKDSPQHVSWSRLLEFVIAHEVSDELPTIWLGMSWEEL
jgi:hypothetical protein